MNFETGYAEAWAARRNPNVPQPAGNVRPVGVANAQATTAQANKVSNADGSQVQVASADAAASNGDEDMSFWDFLDVINPLHHLPVVGDLYREMTGDTIKPSAQVAGGMLFGGPFAMVTGVYGAMVEQTSGQGVGGTLVAALTGDEAAGTATAGFAVQPRAASGISWASLNLDEEPAFGADSFDDAPAEDDGFTPGIMVASVESETLSPAAPSANALVAPATSGDASHHALPKSVVTADDPALNNILLTAADSYASNRSLDAFLTAAATTPAAASQAIGQVAPKAAPAPERGAVAGSIQFAGMPATSSTVTPPAAAQVAAVEQPVAADEPGRRSAPRRTLAAEDANPIPLDDARRFSRAIPLFAGSSSRRDEIKAADVADAANRLALIRAAEREAASTSNDRISPAVARSVAPSEPTLAAPSGPAGIQDPFGRSISSNNLGDKMLQALDKYRSSGNLGGAGI